jgi:hypothetical protein
LAETKKINWVHVSTLIAVAILVGTEMVGASWAAGWALGGLLIRSLRLWAPLLFHAHRDSPRTHPLETPLLPSLRLAAVTSVPLCTRATPSSDLAARLEGKVNDNSL